MMNLAENVDALVNQMVDEGLTDDEITAVLSAIEEEERLGVGD